MTNKDYIKEVVNRVEFYIFLSNNDDVMFKQLNVYRHASKPDQYFIHLKYSMKDEESKNKITYHEEIETYLKLKKGMNHRWICTMNQKNLKKLKKFLKQAILSNIKTDSVKLK